MGSKKPKKTALPAHDHLLFQEAMKDVSPLKTSPKVCFDRPKPAPYPRQRLLDEAQVLKDALAQPWESDSLLALEAAETFLANGASYRLLKDLRRGCFAIQNHLDLHGMNKEEAHEAFRVFLAECALQGERCVRIVHGRGLGSPGRTGVLRKLVRAWLMQRSDVLAFCSAPYYDGGEGALWLLMKHRA